MKIRSHLSTTLSTFFFLLLALIPQLRVISTVFAQDNPIGTIDKPEAVANFDTVGGIGEGDIGVLFFFSRMISYITVIAGIWSFFNLILAGYTYVTSSGNAQNHTTVRDKITMSILGMILIVAVYAIAGILGTVFFGNSLYFLNPTIEGPGTL